MLGVLENLYFLNGNFLVESGVQVSRGPNPKSLNSFCNRIIAQKNSFRGIILTSKITLRK